VGEYGLMSYGLGAGRYLIKGKRNRKKMEMWKKNNKLKKDKF
jgi:hypothetical protein